MALSGYNKKFARKNGGLKRVGLIERESITRITYSRADRAYTDIEFSGDARFAKYEFREDEAEYKEVASVRDGSVVVTHELRFFLERMGNETSAVIGELANAAQNGLVAYIETANGDTFLIGYSPEFGMERPLHLVSASGTTGAALTGGTGENIILRSEDITKALPFRGTVSRIFA